MERRDQIDARLRDLLALCPEPTLHEAMAYSVFAGGKRLRPLLLLGACEAAQGQHTPAALDFACALEMIHTYSLIHDDLPAMDNDDFRRGKPTSHKRFGEAMAILAGDALLNRAFETMVQATCAEGNVAALRAMATLAAAAGDSGMIAGQVADILFQDKKATVDILFSIHQRKTGALFAAALEAGATLGGADAETAEAFRALGSRLGVAFQILDDLLDETSTAENLGKPIHSDAKNHKNTYVTVHGLAKAQADYAALSAEILEDLTRLPQKTQTLYQMVQQVIERKF